MNLTYPRADRLASKESLTFTDLLFLEEGGEGMGICPCCGEQLLFFGEDRYGEFWRCPECKRR